MLKKQLFFVIPNILILLRQPPNEEVLGSQLAASFLPNWWVRTSFWFVWKLFLLFDFSEPPATKVFISLPAGAVYVPFFVQNID